MPSRSQARRARRRRNRNRQGNPDLAQDLTKTGTRSWRLCSCSCFCALLFPILTAVLVYVSYMTRTFVPIPYVDTFGDLVKPIPDHMLKSIDVPTSGRLLADSLAFPTIQGDMSVFAAFEKFLETSFPLIHETLTIHRFDHGTIYIWPGSEPSLHKQPILLNGHADVVPCPDTWTDDVDPFGGVIDDQGYIMGRGAVDNKGNLMGQLCALEILLKHKFQPKRTILLSSSYDEEIGAPRGAIALAKWINEEGFRPLVTIDEGGHISRGSVTKLGVTNDLALIGLSEKKVVIMNVTIHNLHGGHGSMPPTKPEQVVMWQAARFLEKLMSTKLPEHTDHELFQGFVDGAFRTASVLARAIFANLRYSRTAMGLLMDSAHTTRAMVRSTIAPTSVFGGDPLAPNVLPLSLKLGFNIRLHPMDSVDDIVKFVKDCAAAVGIDESMLEIDMDLFKGSHSLISKTDRTYDLLKKTIGDWYDATGWSTTKDAPETDDDDGTSDDLGFAPFLMIAATDMRYYAPISGGHAYHFSPFLFDSAQNDLARFHGIDERLSVSGFGHAIEFYMRVLWNFEQVNESQLAN